jgi:hypothetical protein
MPRSTRRGAAHLIALVVVACGLAACARLETESSSTTQVKVPNVVGLDDTTAAKTLAAAGLVGQHRYVQTSTAPAGQVLGSTPTPGTRVEAAAVVTYDVAELAPPDRMELGQLVDRYPDVFVGLGLDAQRVPLVAFNPGIDITTWEPALDKAAAGAPYRIITCARSRTELAQVQALVGRRDWLPNRGSVALATYIEPASCSVRLTSTELSHEDIRVLTERFGDALTIAGGGAYRDSG